MGTVVGYVPERPERAAAEPTKADLSARAAELGIELPASATKDRIAAAIAEAERAAAEPDGAAEGAE